jgi:hypothetical protein
MKKRLLLLPLALNLATPLFASESLLWNPVILNQRSISPLLSRAEPASMNIKIQETDSKTISPVDPFPQLAQDALSADSAMAQFAIAALRAQGPAGLEAMLNAHAELLKSHPPNSVSTGDANQNETWLRLKTALDSIARQHDSYTSKLYWYTDFERAKVAARVSGKPILSLRLLGNLDEELSCANSRFFRTTLYANAQVSAYLRDHFILHWKSVRPVPKVTIDFGDGRKLERTITGNSIHYVLDSNGQIIDALPGLYGAKAFLAGLQQAEEVAKQCSMAAGGERNRILDDYHCARLAAIESDWSHDLSTIRSLPSSVTHSQLEAATDDSAWVKMASLHSEEARLDQSSRALLLTKAPAALTAGRLTTSKIAIENPVLRQIRNLERTISEDTVRNEYLFHSKIDEWLAAEPATPSLDAFNSKVYAELFLTPDSDPWLGLAQPDICTALENNGLVSNTH